MGSQQTASKESRYPIFAVSYTHLDVYKRQLEARETSWGDFGERTGEYRMSGK